MALPKIEIKVLTPTKASIEVAGKPIGEITIALQEQETIECVDNALVLLGSCENLQDGNKTGFVFSVVKTLDKPVLAATIAEGVQK